MKPPPYGREFLAARQAGRYCNPWIFAGARAFELASRRGAGRLVLPPGEDPVAFDWRCVTGLDVVVRWPDASLQEVESIGALLIRYRAHSVLVLEDLRPDGDRFVSLRPYRRFVARKEAA